ncbi:MAG: NADH-quinone oxidoreductase subunit H [Candidatus Latescibacterota bacterium]|jgi:formate hydrogenlyase subunit 4
MDTWRGLALLSGLVLAPLLPGVINRVKALVAGRHGPPLLQGYWDLAKLLRKGAVYSRTTTWVFRAAPTVGLAAVVAALALVPAGRSPGAVAFAGDLILFAYCLGLMRFVTVLAAMDTGSAFEGMGASREVQFAAVAEPALLLALATLARLTGSLSLTGIDAGLSEATWTAAAPALALIGAALLIVFLAENARIPIDDPNTHLELTMIHEVMVLDYSGPDLAFVLYGAALKLWVLGALIVEVAVATLGVTGPAGAGIFLLGMVVLAMAVGVVESVMARLSLLKVPRLLVAAGALSLLAFTLVLRSVA